MNRKKNYETTEEASIIAKIMRKEGKTYEDIADVLGCSSNVARYYANYGVEKDCRKANKRLKSVIEQSGLSKTEIIRHSGVNYNSLSGYINGTIDPPLSKARALANALGVTVDDIF